MKKSFNQILDNPINIKIYLLPWLILLSLLLSLVIAYFFRDTHAEHEWYTLLDNLIKYKSFSLYIFNEQLIPSALLPPMYAFFLYLIKFITSFGKDSLLYSIIFIQMVLSTYSIHLYIYRDENK